MAEKTCTTDLDSSLPVICGEEARLVPPVSEEYKMGVGGQTSSSFNSVQSVCLVALHMHQPLLPAMGETLQQSPVVSNLERMLESNEDGDRYNASIYTECYARMGRIVPELVAEGFEPRIMLEYSGTLLHGLQGMESEPVIAALKKITCEKEFSGNVEWLGCPWGHAVAPSTPVPDYRLHVKAWRYHFASIFGAAALSRVRGFSPSEMALPNQPDVAFEFVRTLRECGYQWLIVQEHTVEDPTTGASPRMCHIPHRLVCRNSLGEEVSIIAFIKTQGSDTKLVGQMQPYFEAKNLSRILMAGCNLPQAVTQIADGENGGVMMNEFPSKYRQVVQEAKDSTTVLMNGSEYLDFIFSLGLRESSLPVLQPIYQKRIWDRFRAGDGPQTLLRVMEELKKEDGRFHMEGGSWTNNISWVKGYGDLLRPMEQLSVRFNQAIESGQLKVGEEAYCRALFYLLCSQTSCFRYWGQGMWTEAGLELIRRGNDVIDIALR